jgi:hypothetical protein
MKRLLAATAGFLLAALAGCYTADSQLITDDKAVTPYEKFSFLVRGEDDEPTVLFRDGYQYVSHDEDDHITLRFMALEKPDWLIAEMTDTNESGVERLFALIRLDAANKVAYGYATLGGPEDAIPGLRECGEAICIDDLDAYAAHAMELAESDGADVTYDLTLE